MESTMNRQSANLRFISGVGAKGPACFLLDAVGKRIMLDLGEGPPAGLLPNVEGLGPVDALVISHSHKDHIGGLSLLPKLGNPPVYTTEIVASRLPKGTVARPLPLKGSADVLGIEVRTGRNGHAPGGVWLHFAIPGGFLYTGDWSVESLLYAYDPPTEPAGVALVDCSYGTYEKPLRDCWSALAPLVDRGPILLPAPADGRGPELALEALRYGRNDIFLDDPTQSALRQLCRANGASLRPEADDDVKALVAASRPIGQPRGIMLAAAADGTSGAARPLLEQWQSEPEPAIVFTGYRAPGTPADRLIKSGRAQFLRWNVHPRLSDVAALVKAIGARTVIAAFCDRSQLAGLAEALAPARVTMDGPVELQGGP